jgi:hypothetical protein
MKNPETGVGKGFAFVRYASKDGAAAAVEHLDGIEVCGRAVGVVRSQANTTLFVGGLPRDWVASQLETALADAKARALKETCAYARVAPPPPLPRPCAAHLTPLRLTFTRVAPQIHGVEEVTMSEDPAAPGRNRGFGFARFASHSAAFAALGKLSRPRASLPGHRGSLSVSWAREEPSPAALAAVTTLYVRRMPPGWTDVELRAACEPHGTLESVVHARKLPAPPRTDFGFVRFATRAEADAALLALQGVNVADSDGVEVALEVEIAKPRPGKEPHAGGRGAGGAAGGRGGRDGGRGRGAAGRDGGGGGRGGRDGGRGGRDGGGRGGRGGRGRGEEGGSSMGRLLDAMRSRAQPPAALAAAGAGGAAGAAAGGAGAAPDGGAGGFGGRGGRFGGRGGRRDGEQGGGRRDGDQGRGRGRGGGGGNKRDFAAMSGGDAGGGGGGRDGPGGGGRGRGRMQQLQHRPQQQPFRGGPGGMQGGPFGGRGGGGGGFPPGGMMHQGPPQHGGGGGGMFDAAGMQQMHPQVAAQMQMQMQMQMQHMAAQMQQQMQMAHMQQMAAAAHMQQMAAAAAGPMPGTMPFGGDFAGPAGGYAAAAGYYGMPSYDGAGGAGGVPGMPPQAPYFPPYTGPF